MFKRFSRIIIKKQQIRLLHIPKCGIIKRIKRGRNGFDNNSEILIASSGWLLWPLKIKQTKYKS